MIRALRAAVLVLCLLGTMPALQASNTYFWLSSRSFPSPSPLPANFTAIPEFYKFDGQSSGSIYIWARPETGKSLKNWSLNLVCGDSSLLTLDSAEVYGAANTGVTRWEYVSAPTGSATAIRNINGFTLSNNGGDGIGASTAASDSYYDAVQDAWLLAKVDFSLKPFAGFKTANLSLQVGDFGANNFGEGVSDIDIVFGHTGDTPITLSNLNSGNRNVNIGLHDGVIKYYASPDADFDNDLDVDGRDFLIWQRNFLTGTLNTQGNANPGTGPGQDLLVNSVDLAAWQYRYGLPVSIVSAIAVVPEPDASHLVFAGMACAGLGRRGKYRIRSYPAGVTPGGEA